MQATIKNFLLKYIHANVSHKSDRSFAIKHKDKSFFCTEYVQTKPHLKTKKNIEM